MSVLCPTKDFGDQYSGASQAMNPKRVGFLGFEGVAASELTRAADVLAAATLDGGYGNRISCYQISAIGFTSECFRAESGIAFRPDNTLETASELDTIVIPGGDGLRRSLVSETIADWVLARVNETRRVVAIGGGIYGVAPTGLLDGREVTTHWRYASDVARSFPNLRVDPRRHLVKDGVFYTCSGPNAAIDLSLALIEEDYGRHVASVVAQDFVSAPMNGNGQHKLPSPLVFDSQPADRFAELVPWIMRNLHEDLSINTLARRACMSPSHFIGLSKVCSAVRRGRLWRPCESTKQNVVYPFQSELSRPSLPLLDFRTRKHSGERSNGDLERSRALI
jgi:transcriptional regulator GlxA family with amidase domain